MTERKWTPGPWAAVRNSSFWEVNPVREYGEEKPYTIGNVCASDPSDTKGLQEANAHLIAAAPDLYGALEWAINEIEGRTLYTEEGQRDNCIADSKSALAKARGEQ